jgi:O-succinylhomoserine sulfhydrylase
MSKHKQTQAIRIQTERTNEMEHSTPMFLTSSFCFDNAEDMRAAFADESDDNIYSRFSNPGVQEFIDKMCALEGAEAGYATASGMSAVFGSFMALMKQGDHLLGCNAIFGSTHTVISKYLTKIRDRIFLCLRQCYRSRLGSSHQAKYKNDLLRNTNQSGARCTGS